RPKDVAPVLKRGRHGTQGSRVAGVLGSRDPPAVNLDALTDLAASVVLFPVRHHSPTAARLVRALIEDLRPKAVLIEGPSDFNERIDELYLPHRPPVAVYSYVRRAGFGRRGAYHPFCEHSPEWQRAPQAEGGGA